MKTFAKIFCLALTVAVIASMLVLPGMATDAPAAVTDPNQLKPGSERVVFIKDAPRDEKYQVIGELAGDGTGFDADNPLRPIEHEGFDPSASAPKYHLTTAFYQATELLAKEGGTIVVCGPVYFGPMESYGSGASTRDVFTAKFGTNTIKITSVYNGVDYRETAGAKIIVDTPAEIGMYGQSIWENIDIETVALGRVISFDCYTTLVGEGVNCYPSDPAFEGVAGNYISLSAGHRYGKSLDRNPTLTVKSGTYNVITGAMWGVVDTQTNENANVNLVLEGDTTVYGQIIGTTGQKGKFSGNVNITINGGRYECDINGIGVTGMLNTDGIVKIKVNGGDFKNVWSINTGAPGYQNNGPAACTLDFSGWTGELSELANAYGKVSDITDIVFPAGVTGDQVLAAATTAPAVTEAPETDPPATKAPEADATKAPEADKDEDATKAPETNAPVVDNEGEEEGGNMTLIIIVVVAVVVVAGVVVGIVVAKKKK